MRYIEGRPLTKFILPGKPQSPRTVAAIVRKLALALDEAHRQGIIHRDLKPANIMIDGKGEPIVMDFGLARKLDGLRHAFATQFGTFIGTPAYMSPEQVTTDPEKIGAPSDVWGLGVILFELLTGRRPYEGTVMEILGAIQHVDPPPLAKYRDDVPAELDAVCRKMLTRDVEKRLQSMKEVAVALADFLAHSGGSKSGSQSDPAVENSQMAANARQASAGSAPPEEPVPFEFLPEPPPSLVPKSAARRQSTHANRGGSPRSLARSIGGGALALVLLAGLITFFLKRGEITIKVEMDESLANEHVMLILDGDSYTIRNLGQTIRVKPGQKSLEVRRGDERFTTNDFRIERDEKPVLRISVVDERLDVKRTDGPDPGQSLAGMHNTPEVRPDKRVDEPRQPQQPKAAPEPVPVKVDPFAEWMQRVSAMPAETQVKEVVAKLKELNPDYDGNESHSVEGEVVTTLQCHAEEMQDLRPIRALTKLENLILATRDQRQGKLSDLKPLKGMSLKAIDISGSAVSDLSPLNEMKTLQSLTCVAAPLTDLSPLKGLAISVLDISMTMLSSLESLKGMKLTELYCHDTQINDLASLHEMELTDLDCSNTQVSDLSSLRKMKLLVLKCRQTRVADLTPLQDMRLLDLEIAGSQVESLEPIRNMQLRFLDCTNTRISSLDPLKEMTLSKLLLDGSMVTDLSPLKNTELSELSVDSEDSDLTPLADVPLKVINVISFDAKRDIKKLRAIASLETINHQPAKEFLKEAETAIAADPPKGDGWHGWPKSAPAAAIAPFDSKRARKIQETWATYLKVPVEYTNSIGMKFRLIPPGEFLMGSTPQDVAVVEPTRPNWGPWKPMLQSELPRHKVVITKPFYLGVHEVTQQNYEQVVGRNPSAYAATGVHATLVPGRDTRRHPVEMVSWLDAAEFCAELSRKEELDPAYSRSGNVITALDGNGYRLPTEAQWEMACRAGTQTMTWCGNSPESQRRPAWFGRNSGNRTHAVGELTANPFGLFDVLGNVAEWCHDATIPGPYQVPKDRKGERIDPVAEWTEKISSRRLRGGDYWQEGAVSRSGIRWYGETGWTSADCGLRAALSVDAVRKTLDAKKETSPKPKTK